jgi:hypothetical protein
MTLHRQIKLERVSDHIHYTLVLRGLSFHPSRCKGEENFKEATTSKDDPTAWDQALLPDPPVPIHLSLDNICFLSTKSN